MFPSPGFPIRRWARKLERAQLEGEMAASAAGGIRFRKAILEHLHWGLAGTMARNHHLYLVPLQRIYRGFDSLGGRVKQVHTSDERAELCRAGQFRDVVERVDNP